MLSEACWQPESQASLWEAEFCSWFHWGKRKDNKCVSLFIVPGIFLLFNLHFSWTWWDKGRMVTQWSEQMDPDLHGRSSWLCDIYFMSAYSICLSGCRLPVFLSCFCLYSTHTHTHTQQSCSQIIFCKSNSSLLLVLVAVRVLLSTACHPICLEHCIAICKGGTVSSHLACVMTHISTQYQH